MTTTAPSIAPQVGDLAPDFTLASAELGHRRDDAELLRQIAALEK